MKEFNTFYLFPKGEGDCAAKIEINNLRGLDDSSFTTCYGDAYLANGWAYKTETTYGGRTSKEVMAWEFHSSINIRWDGCSHWNFYGQDFDPDAKDLISEVRNSDAYYHLCGGGMFLNFITLMAFAWKCAQIMYKAGGYIEEEEFNLEEVDYLLRDLEIVWE